FVELEKVVPDVHHYLAKKQLEILPYTQWYLPSGRFDADAVLKSWVTKARHTETQGFAGIRITGNPVWLKSEEDWTQFGQYEHTVHRAIRKERVIALCTYPMAICEPKTILHTLSSHSVALLPEKDRWRRLELSTR